MKTRTLLVIMFAVAFALPAVAGTRVPFAGSNSPKYAPGSDHPLAQPIANENVRVQIATDKIFRSCCAPPELVVSGKVTNIASQPIDYVRLVLQFKDSDGHVVHAEDTYNSKAITMFEDPEIARMLNEKPHFEPLAPGASDKFVFSVPMPLLPRYQTVSLGANVRHGAKMARVSVSP
jgi:hypothetical protein